MRRKVAVIVDGTAAVPPAVSTEYDIGVLPFHVIVDGRDRIDAEVDLHWLFDLLRQRRNVPTTAAPSIGEALRAYDWAAERADTAISIHLTSAFSKSYESGLEARALAKEKYPQMQIEVIDSRTGEAGELAMAIEAAGFALKGASFDEVVQRAYEVRDSLSQFYCFETLFYRDKGGRTFKAKPWAEAENNGGAGLRALLEVDHSTDGTVRPICRAKTKKQLFKKMIRLASERMNGAALCAAIVHVNAAQEAESLGQLLRDELQCERIQVAHSCAATAVQSGEGFIAFACHASTGGLDRT